MGVGPDDIVRWRDESQRHATWSRAPRPHRSLPRRKGTSRRLQSDDSSYLQLRPQRARRAARCRCLDGHDLRPNLRWPQPHREPSPRWSAAGSALLIGYWIAQLIGGLLRDGAVAAGDATSPGRRRISSSAELLLTFALCYVVLNAPAKTTPTTPFTPGHADSPRHRREMRSRPSPVGVFNPAVAISGAAVGLFLAHPLGLPGSQIIGGTAAGLEPPTPRRQVVRFQGPSDPAGRPSG